MRNEKMKWGENLHIIEWEKLEDDWTTKIK